MPKLSSLFYTTTCLVLLCSLWSCTSASSSADGDVPKVEPTQIWHPPPAGAVVAQHEEKVVEDSLNDLFFRVEVISTATSAEGHYNLLLSYGFNLNETEMDLPNWPNQVALKPVVQKGTEPYHCFIGFDPGDGEFRPLYEVQVEHKNIRMKQTHQYYHQ